MKVLIVNENNEICRWIATVFEENNWDVVSKSSNTDVLPALLEDNYDAMILPMLSRGISGMQSLLAVRGIDEKIKIILIGEDMTDNMKQESLANGVFGFLDTPFTTDDLEKAISDLENAVG